MADKTEFLQAIDDAILDADSLERFINGSEDETVLTRLSAEYPTLQKALKELFENGGLPATPFKTKALMTASTLVDGKYAQVTDDTINNGLYVKTAGSWVKSAYDPLTQAKSYADDVLPKYYKNDWDKDAVVLGNLGSTGNLVASSSIYVSGFIGAEAGSSYTASVGNIGVQAATSKVAFYDANQVFIAGSLSEHKLSTGQSYTSVAPAGAAYRRYTISQSARDLFVVTYGTVGIAPDQLGKYYDLGFLGGTDAPAIPEDSITEDYIADKSVRLAALADDVLPMVYKNEWDKHTVSLGNFSLATGILTSSTAVYVTDLISVKAGEVFSFYQGEVEGGVSSIVRVGFYTTGKVWISGTDNNTVVGGSFTKTAPEDGFMRVSNGRGGLATLMVNVGSTPFTEDQIGEVANFGLFDGIKKPLLRPKSVTARYIAKGTIGEDELAADLLAKINKGGGGGYVPRKYPSPPTIPFVEVGVSNDEAYWLSEDGEVLYIRNFFQLKQSMDDLDTPAVNIGAPFAKQVRGVRLLADGQLLVTTARDNSDNTRAQVWKSNNYDRNSPAGTTFRLVHTAIGDYAEFYNHWGIDCYQNIVVLCEYGTKENLGARRVYLSQDTGETFSLIFYQPDVHAALGIPYNEASAHTHTAAYDPWFNRIWVVAGDGINAGTFYSDDLGSTWQVVAGSTGLTAVQYTGIIALADCVVFGSDRAPNGLHIFERTLNRSDPVTIKPWSIVDSFSTTSKIFQMPFRRALGEPVYFGSFHDNRVGDGRSVVMSFVDKYSVTLAYELPFLYTEAIGNLGMQHVIGATAQGNIFTSYYTGSQQITLKGPAPIWS